MWSFGVFNENKVRQSHFMNSASQFPEFQYFSKNFWIILTANIQCTSIFNYTTDCNACYLPNHVLQLPSDTDALHSFSSPLHWVIMWIFFQWRLPPSNISSSLLLKLKETICWSTIQSKRHNQETTTMKPSFADAEVCSKFLFRFCLLMGPSSAPPTFIDKNWFYPYRFNTIVFTHQK